MRYCYLVIFFILPITLLAQGKDANDDDSSLFYILNLNNRFELKRNFLNSDKPDKLVFSEDGYGYYFYTGGTLIWFISDNLELDVSLNSGIIKISNLYYENGKTSTTINYGSPMEYVQKSLFIDEVFLEYDNSLKLSFGKANVSASTDFVFNDYVFFAKADFYLYRKQKKELTFGLQYNTIDGYFNADYKSSPMITADITYRNGKVFGLSLFSSFLYDNDNAFGKVYEPFVESFVAKKITEAGADLTNVCSGELSDCLGVDSSAYILWFGFDLNGKMSAFHYHLSAIGNYGEMDLVPYLLVNGQKNEIYAKKKKVGKLTDYLKYGNSDSSQVSYNSAEVQGSILNKSLSERLLFGYMAFLEIGYKFFKLLDISPYFLYMSGENDLEKSGYLNSFVSIKSYITLSNIFFNGGLNETASSRSFSMAGVNGKGVINPGIWLRFGNEKLPLKANFGIMRFYASSKNINDNDVYGTEFDFVSIYSLSRYLDISLEADYFIVGNFFKTDMEGLNNPFKILLGVNLFVDNLD